MWLPCRPPFHLDALSDGFTQRVHMGDDAHLPAAADAGEHVQCILNRARVERAEALVDKHRSIRTPPACARTTEESPSESASDEEFLPHRTMCAPRAPAGIGVLHRKLQPVQFVLHTALADGEAVSAAVHHFKQTICLFRHRTQHRLQHKAGQREPLVDGEAIHKGGILSAARRSSASFLLFFLVFVQQLFFAGDERALRTAGRRRFVQARKAFRLPIERALQLRPLLPGHGLRRSVGLFLRSVQRLVMVCTCPRSAAASSRSISAPR